MIKNWLKKSLALLCFLGFLGLFSCSFKGDIATQIKKEIKNDFLTSGSEFTKNTDNNKWWLGFQDQCLSHLIEAALRNNKDVQIANLAIITSRQLNNVNASALFPTGTAGLTRQRFSSPGFGPNGVSYDIFQAAIDASWELDFFGKNLDRYKAGKMRFLGEAQLYKATSLRVASEIAQNYFLLKSTQKQIINLEKIADLRNKILAINQKKESIGISSKESIYKAKIDLNLASSNLIDLQTNEKILRYKLAVLLGTTPENINEILSEFNSNDILTVKSPKVFLGLKSEIIQRRPDVMAAFYEVEASGFEQSAQIKEFFPSFTLAAKIGGGGKDLSQVIGKGTNVKDIRGTFSVPVFSLASLIAEYKISKVKTKTAVLNYEKTVLSAIEECESQILKYANALKVENNSSQSFKANSKILEINQNKKKLGIISNDELLLSQVSEVESENIFIQKKSESLTNLVSLYKSLGGGFDGYEIKFEDDRVLWIDKARKEQ